jgi:monoamine oxidase
MEHRCDVIVVGGGTAGLACAAELGRHGRRVLLLEATGRLGGRIHTISDQAAGVSVELGAEFIHGRPAEIFDLLEAAGMKAVEASGEDWCVTPSGLSRCEFFEQTHQLLDRMKSIGERDLSFAEFLATVPDSEASPAVRKRTLGYVEGFNAARAEEISVQSLLDDMRAQDATGGETSYRLPGGYVAVVELLKQQCEANNVEFRFGEIVAAVDYSRAEIEVSGSNEQGPFRYSAAAAAVTLPAAVLRAGAIRFAPSLPAETQRALNGVATGQVLRLTLVFKERFWAGLKSRDGRALDDMRFLFSEDPLFPTWWTTHPLETPVLVAWSPARKTEALFGRGKEFAVAKALDGLSAHLGIHRAWLTELLAGAHMHDWHSDKHFLGAYSYYCVGAADAPEVLSRPLDGRLFLAGEATATGGYHSTVHGAIASGYRAARQICGEQLARARNNP